MTKTQTWTTEGFEGFGRGTFSNAGHNLYVSRAGVLQRIHQYDLNKDGYFDLVFANDHDHGENAPTYVYRDALGSASMYEVPSDGAWSGAMADLNGDGYDDLVLGMLSNGSHPKLNSFIYYGSAEGFSERRRRLLPAPMCVSVAAGDFNGDGKPDLAYLCRKGDDSSDAYVRIFYQTDLGFESDRYEDIEIDGDQLAASDLDGDGYADLVVRSQSGAVTVYWGSSEGVRAGWASVLAGQPDDSSQRANSGARLGAAVVGAQEMVLPAIQLGEADPYYEAEPRQADQDAHPIPTVVHLKGVPHVLVAGTESVSLVPVSGGRRFGVPLELACRRPMAAAVGDITGDGHEDLVVACREAYGDGECSWVYWGGEEGYDDSRRTRLASERACDVAVADLDGNGHDDVIVCQNRTLESYTTVSLVYRGGPEGIEGDAARLTTEDARRVFAAKSPSGGPPALAFVNHWSRVAARGVSSYVYYGGPDGFSADRRAEVHGERAVDSLCCDVNDDGYADLILVNSSLSTIVRDSGSYVFLNGPDGLPKEPSIVIPTARAHGSVCADLNRDGYLDLVFGGVENSELLVFYGTEDGFDTDNPERIRLEKDGVLYDDVRFITLADWNNDGWLDIYVPQITENRSFILWGGPEGFSMDRCQMLAVGGSGSAEAADLTANGYLDLIVGGGSTHGFNDAPHASFVHIYWNGPDGLREDRRTSLPGNAAGWFAVADFNNNGLLDVFTCCYHDGRVRDIDSYIYWNRPDTGFSVADRHRMFTHSAAGSIAADFNEDGWTDLAIAYHKIDGDHVGNSAVWWNGPDGFVEGRVTELPTLGPHGMVGVNPGNIMDRGPEELYLSSSIQLLSGASISSISWEADVPAKTWVKAQLRSADTEDGLQAAPWRGPTGDGSWYENGQRPQATESEGWLQYRLALGATNSLSTPRVRRVDVQYEVL